MQCLSITYQMLWNGAEITTKHNLTWQKTYFNVLKTLKRKTKFPFPYQLNHLHFASYFWKMQNVLQLKNMCLLVPRAYHMSKLQNGAVNPTAFPFLIFLLHQFSSMKSLASEERPQAKGFFRLRWLALGVLFRPKFTQTSNFEANISDNCCFISVFVINGCVIWTLTNLSSCNQ